MKTGGYLARETPLKSYTRLEAHSTFKKPTLDQVKAKQSLKRATGAKKPKGTTLKEKLDRLFSKYVRLTHADGHGQVKCATCPATRSWKEMDAGHFVSRTYLATRYDETNVFPQCPYCNRFKHGNMERFEEFIAFTFGPLHADVLRIRAQAIVPDFPYRELIAEYTLKLKAINQLEATL